MGDLYLTAKATFHDKEKGFKDSSIFPPSSKSRDQAEEKGCSEARQGSTVRANKHFYVYMKFKNTAVFEHVWMKRLLDFSCTWTHFYSQWLNWSKKGAGGLLSGSERREAAEYSGSSKKSQCRSSLEQLTLLWCKGASCSCLDSPRQKD